jgi:hypothetical protein
VLGKPAQDDRVAIDTALGASLEILPQVLAGDLQGAMLKLHSQAAVERPAQSAKPEKPKRAAQAQPAEQPKEPKKDGKAGIKTSSADTSAKTEQEPGKPGGLGSFFKKFLPDSGATPKK